MKDTQTTRRQFLKVSTGTVGVLASPVSMAWAKQHRDASELDAQSVFIKRVLNKNVRRSNRIHRKHVAAFAEKFGETYGVVAYRELYSGLVGEYRLTRMFVRSLNRSA